MGAINYTLKIYKKFCYLLNYPCRCLVSREIRGEPIFLKTKLFGFLYLKRKFKGASRQSVLFKKIKSPQRLTSFIFNEVRGS